MTKIKRRDKPVWHETGQTEQGRPIAVAETPFELLLRLKGKREVLSLPWSSAFLRAATAAAEAARNRKIHTVRRGALI